MTEHESREERGRRELEEQLREGFRRPYRRPRGSFRITIEDTEHGRELEVDDGRPARWSPEGRP